MLSSAVLWPDLVSMSVNNFPNRLLELRCSMLLVDYFNSYQLVVKLIDSSVTKVLFPPVLLLVGDDGLEAKCNIAVFVALVSHDEL